jgi:hypothetical protein
MDICMQGGGKRMEALLIARFQGYSSERAREEFQAFLHIAQDGMAFTGKEQTEQTALQSPIVALPLAYGPSIVDRYEHLTADV